MTRRLLPLGTLALVLVACATETADSTSPATSQLAANVPITVLRNDHGDPTQLKGRPDAVLTSLVRAGVDLAGMREAKVEEVRSPDGATHLVVQLLTEGYHQLTVTRLDVDEADKITRVVPNYARAEEDQVHGTTAPVYHCPDPEVQFVTLCPNDNTAEIGWANEAGDAAEAAGLKTVRLMKSQATHDAWLSYMACPKLVGNFYDGDANTSEIVVYDGAITAREFTTSVSFNLEVTNIWLACQAYNDPMLTAVQKTSKSQKYAAGINNLAVGPSDKAAVCAMKAALEGKPMTQSFQDCYRQLDRPTDKWGFGGDGSDFFGQAPPSTGTTGTGTGTSSTGTSTGVSIHTP